MTSLMLSLVDPSGEVRDSIDPCEWAEGNQDLSSGPVDLPMLRVFEGMSLPPMLTPFLKMFQNLTVRLEIRNVAIPQIIEGECSDPSTDE